MAAGRAEILSWLDTGRDQGASHVIVVCDTFDYEDFPVYVFGDAEAARDEERKQNAKSMQKVMEVYNLKKNWTDQLNRFRCFEY